MKVTQSKRTVVVAKACKEFNERHEHLLSSRKLHPYSKVAKSEKDSLIETVSKEFGIKKNNLAIILSI